MSSDNIVQNKYAKYDKSQQMIEFNKLLQSECDLNFGEVYPTNNKESNLEKALFIKEKYETSDPYDLLKQCLTIKEVRSIVLSYELRNFSFETVDNMSLVDFSKIALEFLNRYQHKAGGYMLHHHQWTLHDQTSSQRHLFQMKNNEILFVNSIDNNNEEDIETEIFIDILIDKLNTIATNIEVKQSVYEIEKSKIQYILLSAIDKTKKNKKK